MNDSIKAGVKGFFNGNPITQLIVLIIFIIGAGTYIFIETRNNEQDKMVLEEMKETNENIERLFIGFIEKQEDIDSLKECMNEKHNEAIEIFEKKFKSTLARTLAGVGMMQFPEDLNTAFTDFKDVFFLDMKNCLINPDVR